MNAREWVEVAPDDRVTTEKLKADLRVLAADMEQLLTATAGETGQRLAQARAKAEESLKAVKARAADLQDDALAKTRAAGRATDAYVHANPWRVVAVGAAVGLLVGLALSRGESCRFVAVGARRASVLHRGRMRRSHETAPRSLAQRTER